MRKLIIGIVGKIHSGKSTLAREISQSLEIPIVSFGGYLKDFSLKNDLPTDRESLQSLGNKRILNNPVSFIEDVLSGQEDSSIIIIEGIRHESVLLSLKKTYHQSYFIFLDVTFDERYSRYTNGKNILTKDISVEEFFKIDNHQVESEINNLKERCDYTLNSIYLVNELIELINEKIKLL